MLSGISKIAEISSKIAKERRKNEDNLQKHIEAKKFIKSEGCEMIMIRAKNKMQMVCSNKFA